MEATLFVPNAIIFVFDPSIKDVKVPEYVDDALISVSESCISVGTQADIDGEVRVILTDHFSPNNELSVAFKGSIKTPSNKVAVVTSSFDVVLELETGTEATSILIWLDDATSPSVVAIDVE